MHHARFFDWLYDVTTDWLGRLVAGLLLLSFVAGGVRFYRSARAQQRADNARYERANAALLKRAAKSPGR